MRCSFWEFETLVLHEQLRRGGPERRPLPNVLAFLIGGSGPAASDPRAPGWIKPDSRIHAQWQEILTTLLQGSAYGFVSVSDPDAEDVRAVVAVKSGFAVRVVVRGEQVDFTMVRPDAPWPALAAVLPKAAVGDSSEVTVPGRVLAEARAEAARHQDHQVDWIAYELRALQVPAEDAQAVGALLRKADQVTARITVAIGEDGVLRGGPVAIEVHHAPSGRVAVVPEPPDGTYTMVTPADTVVIVEAVHRYIEDLWMRTGEESLPLADRQTSTDLRPERPATRPPA